MICGLLTNASPKSKGKLVFGITSPFGTQWSP
jgi:hypothetical protein